MKVSITELGTGNFFFNIEGYVSIPLNRIRQFDFNAPCFGQDRAVQIFTDDPNDNIIFTDENYDVIKNFVLGK